MRHLTTGIIQDTAAPDRFYFSPGRVLRTLQAMLDTHGVVAHPDFPAMVAGELVCQAVQAEHVARETETPCRS